MIFLVLIVLVLASLSAGEDCFFLVDGAPRQCVKVTNTSSPVRVMVTALGPCQLRLLAVGGGGRGFEYGGGGAGYLANLAQGETETFTNISNNNRDFIICSLHHEILRKSLSLCRTFPRESSC